MAAVLRRLACATALAIASVGLGGMLSVPARADVLSAAVSPTPSGPTMGQGFLGVSFEFRAVHEYTGRDPGHLDPVLLGLLDGLAPDQSKVIRIGGNSTDDTWWPIRGVIPPGGINYSLDPDWLATTKALATRADAKLILGVNLAAGSPQIAAAEGRAFASGIGASHIDALEIGNEPDLYPSFVWFRDRRGKVYRRRGAGYDLADYTRQFSTWAGALPKLPLAGPVTSRPTWMGDLGSFISAEPRLKLVTYHRYPLRGCTTDPTDPTFPSIPSLLSDTASAGLAAGMAPFVQATLARHLPFRVAEMNSVSCQGAPGVSDTFAAALWGLDTMFQFAQLGVQGVNFHMLPGSHYELFTVSRTPGGGWQAFVHPVYYGLQMFAQAFPPGARLEPVSAPPGPTKVWATVGSDGTERVTLINKDPAAEHDVQVTIPGASATGSLETLTAPNVGATSGVALGGQTYGAETRTGTLPGAPASTPVIPAGGVYTVPLPAGSAALLTIGGGAVGGGSPLAVR